MDLKLAGKVGKYIPCIYSISTISAFDGIPTNHDEYRGKKWMKKFFESLKEYRIKIINFENNEMIPLANKEHEPNLNQANCYICKRSSKAITLVIKI